MDYKPSELLIEDDLENNLGEDDEALVPALNEDDPEYTKTVRVARKPGLRDVEIRRTIEEHLERKRRKQSGEYLDLEELAELEEGD